MNYSNQNLDELIRTAEHEDNSLALAILAVENDDDLVCPLQTLIDDIAVHFAQEIDEKLEAYIQSYYNDSESDYFDFLYDFASDHIETDQLQGYMDENDIELDIETVTDRLDQMADYYCEVEINHNYAASRNIAIQGACIGEIEESMELITDNVPSIFSDTEIGDKIYTAILETISSVHVHKDSDCVYIDMSDTFVSLVINADMIDELFAPEEE